MSKKTYHHTKYSDSISPSEKRQRKVAKAIYQHKRMRDTMRLHQRLHAMHCSSVGAYEEEEYTV